MSIWRPIYEWRWTMPSGEVKTTQSAQKSSILRHFAEQRGGTFERVQVGLRLAPTQTRQLNKLLREALEE